VAATHRDLKAAIAENTFREDLYYRLNVINVTIPSLKERGGDIPLLSHHFLARFNAKNDKSIPGFSKAALAALEAFNWPGNVRQLANVIERAVVLTPEGFIDLDNLPQEVTETPPRQKLFQIPLGTPLDEIDRLVILETLRITGGNKTKAARLLGISPRTIYRKLE
jgi:two-component system response regulator HydG